MKKETYESAKITIVILFILNFLLVTSCTKESVIEVIEALEEIEENEEIEEMVEGLEALGKLEGEWIRIASNNPNADGMIVQMSGTSGTIKNQAGSGFEVADLKWKDIDYVDSETYSHSELGSDYNYYSASMQLKEDDTLRISVGSSGAGNVQKWVREGEYTPSDTQGTQTTELLDCSIAEVRTLVNGPAEIDYRVDCVLDVTAPLTIEPGTVIQFGENAGLGIYDGGTLNAVGTVAEPIVFQGETDLAGVWRGIHLETRSIDNQLENVRIQNAGSNYVYCCNEKASLFLKDAKIGLNGVNISNGGGIGMMVLKDTEFEIFKNIRIESHKEYPVHIEAKLVTNLDGENSDYSGNEKDFVYVSHQAINEPSTWYGLNVPYLMEGKVFDITGALTLEAGVEMVFQQNAGLGVFNDGSLKVKGIENAPVIMRGATTTPGYWRGIHLETANLENALNFLHVSDAGGNYVYCCNEASSLYLKEGTASITNSTFSNGNSYGIFVKPKFEFEAYTANTITTHQEAPLFIPANTMGQLDGTKSTYQGNSKNYIKVYNSAVDEDISVLSNDVPFQVETGAVIDVTAILGLQDGVEMVFEENAGLGVYDNGVLNAVGTADKKITLRGLRDVIGYWRGIHTETNSASNIIRYAEIRNAGSNYVYCCNDKAALLVKKGQMTVENSRIAQSGGCGIQVKPGASFAESNNDYSENTGGNLCN